MSKDELSPAGDEPISGVLVGQRPRLVPLLLLYLGIVLGFLWPLMFDSWVGVALAGVQSALGFALLLFAPRLTRARAPKPVSLHVTGGVLNIQGDGVRERVKGKELQGATAARLEHGVALTLATKTPYLLDVPSLEDAKRALAALGVGHDGFGAVRFPLDKRGPSGRLSRALRILGACLLVASLTAVHDAFAVLLLFQVIALVGAALTPFGVGSGTSQELCLTPAGVVTYWPHMQIPYGAIRDVMHVGGRIHIKVFGRENDLVFPVPPSPPSTLTEPELSHVVAQIRDASLRARGFGAERPLVAAEVLDLGRQTANLKAWVERVDRVAHESTGGGAGVYRGRMLDQDALWEAVESHDAPGDVRIAAARILAKGSAEERQKLRFVADSVREQKLGKALRAAIEEDHDAAAWAEALAELEVAEDQQKRL